MLVQLHVKNLAIVENVRIEFGSGLNVITGQTGAGKSILLAALALVLGKKTDQRIIRDGESSGLVEASFDFSDMSSLAPTLRETVGPFLDERETIMTIRRTVVRDGKSRCFINGQLVSLSQLRGVTQNLIDIQGQHDDQALFQGEQHRLILDAFGELGCDVREISDIYHKDRLLAERQIRLMMGAKDKAQQMEWLAFQIQELEAAQLWVGEHECLEQEKQTLSHFEEIHALNAAAVDELSGHEEALLSGLTRVMKRLQSLAMLDESYQGLMVRFQDDYFSLADIAKDLEARLEALHFDPDRMAHIQERLYLIQSLCSKYRKDVPALIAWTKELIAKRDALNNSHEAIDDIDQERCAIGKILEERAKMLHKKRQAVAEQFDKKVTALLRSLGMPHAHFQTNMTKLDACQSHGDDQIEFQLQANLGEASQPLAFVASGGEISRVLLAVKKTLGDKDQVPVSVFDEIDANVGGEAAVLVGKLLRDIARKRQVLCVTHLPQIACLGDIHFRVEKRTYKKRTQLCIVRIKGEERISEMTRMLGGNDLTSVTKQHARELINTVLP